MQKLHAQNKPFLTASVHRSCTRLCVVGFKRTVDNEHWRFLNYAILMIFLTSWNRRVLILGGPRCCSNSGWRLTPRTLPDLWPVSMGRWVTVPNHCVEARDFWCHRNRFWGGGGYKSFEKYSKLCCTSVIYRCSFRAHGHLSQKESDSARWILQELM